MKIFKNLFFVVMIIALFGNSMNKTQVKKDDQTLCIDAVTGATKAEIKFAFLAGASYGGIVHNREMAGVSGVSDVDVITGATKLAYNAGIHTILKGHGRTIEVGLDYIKVNKSVEYDIPSFSVSGIRSFEAHQIRLPLTYDFGFFENYLNQPKLVFKIGLSPGYTFSKTIEDSEDSENMPEYDFSDWDVCGNFGFYYYPFDFKQDYRMGLYLDFCRGLKAYNDIYHESWTLGGSALMNFGIVFEP
jgi:hypothetical protein